MIRRIKVQAFASDACHLADVPEDILTPARIFNSDFTAVPLPAVMLCGVVLRKRYGYKVAIKMLDEVKVNCRACRRVADVMGAR